MLARRYNALIYIGQGCFLAYYVIAFQRAGLPLVLISIANSAFDITSVVCELPTSVLFDKWSAKKIMVLGAASRFAGFMLFLFDSSNFWIVLLGELLTGLGSSTETGAASALYVEEREEKERGSGAESRVERKFAELGETVGLSVILGGVIGAILYRIAPSLIWVGAGVAYLLAMLTLLRMKEHRRRRMANVSLQSLATDLLRSVFRSVRIPECWLLVSLDVGAMSMALLWPLLLGGDHDTMWLQLVGLVAMNGASALAGRLGMIIDSTPGRCALYVGVDIVALCFTALVGNDVALLGAFFIHVCAHAMIHNVFCGKLYRVIRPDERASVMSVVSLLSTLAIAVLQPIVGWFGQTHLSLAALCTAPVLLASLVYLGVGRHHSRETSA